MPWGPTPPRETLDRDHGDRAPVLEVTGRDFEKEVEKSPEPTVVIFISDACPQCRAIMPYVDGLVRDFRNRDRFVTMDFVANPWTTERYGVREIPTFTFFCHGRPVQELVVAILPAAIKRQVEEFVVRGEECVRTSTGIEYEITGYG